MSLSLQDAEGVSLIIIDSTFTIKKLKMIYKEDQCRFVTFDKSI